MRRENGITLVSLVITIVVMLIIAGISIGMIMSENNPIKRAVEGIENWRNSVLIEEVNLILSDFIFNNFLEQDDAFTDFLKNKVESGQFQEIAYAGMFLVKYQDRYFELIRKGSVYEVLKILDDGVDGTYVIITPSTIENNKNEKIELEDGKQYIVLDSVDARDFNFHIKSGQNISIRLVGNMTIDNRDYSNRSAIEIESGGKLDLHVYGNVTVNSSFGGKSGSGTSAEDIKGGTGANAGIHVPSGAELNLYGNGKIICIGGDAGNGGTCPTNEYDAGGGGGGGAGAGIGGNGGNGGDTAYSQGNNGDSGESAGRINIYDTVTVYAYGGGAGSGGDATPTQGKGGGRRWRWLPRSRYWRRRRWWRRWIYSRRWRRLFFWWRRSWK